MVMASFSTEIVFIDSLESKELLAMGLNIGIVELIRIDQIAKCSIFEIEYCTSRCFCL